MNVAEFVSEREDFLVRQMKNQTLNPRRITPLTSARAAEEVPVEEVIVQEDDNDDESELATISDAVPEPVVPTKKKVTITTPDSSSDYTMAIVGASILVVGVGVAAIMMKSGSKNEDSVEVDEALIEDLFEFR